MKKIIILSICFLTINLYSQEETRIESVYQECMYNSLADKGVKLKRYTKEFESYLVEISVLKDDSSKSYRKLLKSLFHGKRQHTNLKYSYMDSIHTLEAKKIIPVNKKCMEYITDYKEFNGFKGKLSSIVSEDLDDSNQMLKKFYNVLSLDDYNLDYYKQKILFLFLMLNDLQAIDDL